MHFLRRKHNRFIYIIDAVNGETRVYLVERESDRQFPLVGIYFLIFYFEIRFCTLLRVINSYKIVRHAPEKLNGSDFENNLFDGCDDFNLKNSSVY